MTTKEAIERLDSMQSQIIHGKRTFGDIADVIRNLEAVRIAEVCRIVEEAPTASNPKAHRPGARPAATDSHDTLKKETKTISVSPA